MSLEGNTTGNHTLTGKIKSLLIDKTLSITGACAEAKVTGDAIRSVAENFTVHNDNSDIHITADERQSWNCKAPELHASRHAIGGVDPLTAEQIGARPNTWTPTAEEVGALPTTGGVANYVEVRNGESSGYVGLYNNGEGGTVVIGSPDGTYKYEIDAHNNNSLRVHTAGGNGTGTAKFLYWWADTGDLDVGGATVINIGTPSAYHHAANKDYVDSMILKIFPVGYVYMSTIATSPASLFGGTWEQLTDRFLLAAGGSYAVNSRGGEATHTLTISEMPSHNHTQGIDGTHHANYFGSGGVGGKQYSYSEFAAGGEAVYTFTEGGGAAHNNMPPYYAVYMWIRTA